jgi:hypothetical protein
MYSVNIVVTFGELQNLNLYIYNIGLLTVNIEFI